MYALLPRRHMPLDLRHTASLLQRGYLYFSSDCGPWVLSQPFCRYLLRSSNRCEKEASRYSLPYRLGIHPFRYKWHSQVYHLRTGSILTSRQWVDLQPASLYPHCVSCYFYLFLLLCIPPLRRANRRAPYLFQEPHRWVDQLGRQ